MTVSASKMSITAVKHIFVWKRDSDCYSPVMILFFCIAVSKKTRCLGHCFSMLSERASLKYTLESCNIENYLFCRPVGQGGVVSRTTTSKTRIEECLWHEWKQIKVKILHGKVTRSRNICAGAPGWNWKTHSWSMTVFSTTSDLAPFAFCDIFSAIIWTKVIAFVRCCEENEEHFLMG